MFLIESSLFRLCASPTLSPSVLQQVISQIPIVIFHFHVNSTSVFDFSNMAGSTRSCSCLFFTDVATRPGKAHFGRADHGNDTEVDEANRIFFSTCTRPSQHPQPIDCDERQIYRKASSADGMRDRQGRNERCRAVGRSGGLLRTILTPVSAFASEGDEMKYEYRSEDGWSEAKPTDLDAWEKIRGNIKSKAHLESVRQVKAIPVPISDEWSEVIAFSMRDDFKNLKWVDEFEKRRLREGGKIRDVWLSKDKIVEHEIRCQDNE